MSDTVAVVLAGGEGKRFWPLQTSKSMVHFLGKPLLVHNLNRLKKTGITDVIVVCHPQDQKACSQLSVSGLTIHALVQPNPNGMAGAVLAAAPLIQSRACFIMNAEDLVEEQLYVNMKHSLGGKEIVCVGMKMKQYFPGAYLVFRKQRIAGIVEKPGEGHEPSDVAKLVFDYLPDTDGFMKILRTMKSEHDDIYERALHELLKNAEAKLLMYQGYWQPIKHPWHVLDVMSRLIMNVTDFRGKYIEVKGNVVIEGPVYIGDDVKIYENTKIVGPCYIGTGTIIGNNNMIRASHIGAGCVTGFNTDITRSYIGDNCWFHSNYIGDSVIEGDVSMGSGNVLANLRLDEGEIYSVVRGERMNTKRTKLGAIIGSHVRIGVNTSIMPGVKIGANSLIGAGFMIDRDIPEESFVAGGTAIVVTKNTRTILLDRSSYKQKLP